MKTPNLINYWRNTLADAARMEIKPEGKTIYKKDCKIDLTNGTLDHHQATELIDQEEARINFEKGIEDKNSENWQRLEEVPILLSPLHLPPTPEYLQITGEEGPFLPFWIKSILNRQGILKADDEAFPYIPRIYLEPQVNDKINFIFSDVDTIDHASAANAFSEQGWQAYWTYVQSVFYTCTKQLIDSYALDNFTITKESIVIINNIIRNPADGIIQLYDFMLKSESIPPLMRNLCNINEESVKPSLLIEDFESASLLHLGQMGYEYPLSTSQRKSLYHFASEGNGSILAVNGPPGTGKTTLLQSIVANEVVSSAIEGGSPRIIVACSTNNQAVTNIIDSFQNVKARQGILFQRWIPDIGSFGLYFPSKSKKVDSKILFFKGIFDDGIHRKIENHSFVEKATKMYKESFYEATGLNLSVKEIVAHLHDELKQRRDDLTNSISLWKEYKTIPTKIHFLGADDNSLFVEKELNLNRLDEIEASIVLLEKRVSDYIDSESIWIKIFSFFRFVKEQRSTRLKQIFRDCPISYANLNFYYIGSLQTFFDRSLNLIKSIRKVHRAWSEWKNRFSIKGNPPISEKELRNSKSQFYYDELEVGVKNEMFYLATHYWEGRWILETEDVLNEDRITKNGQTDAERRFQRFAMLTPCFVSTFFMAPKFFTYSKFVKKLPTRNVFEAPPLLECIDLLIVDEAGQVSPEVGAATFALAKKAIVVGDVKQIEPVWSVPPKIDHANLYRKGLISNCEDNREIENLCKKGFLASSGSIMMLAQKSSAFRRDAKSERGMLLTEHRRCFDEIIQYCNKLAYDGFLNR